MTSSSGAVLNWHGARIDIEKFRDYSMNPNNPNNRGKAEAFRALGWNVDDPGLRQLAAQDVISLLRAQLPPRTWTAHSSDYGARFDTATVLSGPNRKAGTLRATWQVDVGDVTMTPRLITNWLEVHR